MTEALAVSTNAYRPSIAMLEAELVATCSQRIEELSRYAKAYGVALQLAQWFSGDVCDGELFRSPHRFAKTNFPQDLGTHKVPCAHLHMSPTDDFATVCAETLVEAHRLFGANGLEIEGRRSDDEPEQYYERQGYKWRFKDGTAIKVFVWLNGGAGAVCKMVQDGTKTVPNFKVVCGDGEGER